MYTQIGEILQKCTPCLKYTLGKHGYHPMKAIHSSLPGDHFIIDLIEFIPSTTKQTHCLILIDTFTQFIILQALKDKSAESVAMELYHAYIYTNRSSKDITI